MELWISKTYHFLIRGIIFLLILDNQTLDIYKKKMLGNIKLTIDEEVSRGYSTEETYKAIKTRWIPKFT